MTTRRGIAPGRRHVGRFLCPVLKMEVVTAALAVPKPNNPPLKVAFRHVTPHGVGECFVLVALQHPLWTGKFCDVWSIPGKNYSALAS